ncbi:FAD-dependent oxidoreductase [Paraliomyxa miuraensis]|uniref:FAD-dependent oxidoreductase n=1 Tax=Paraliomyxa miuraensis TaxID=376150 RepID=UPI00224D6C64|nr:FAD-dependent oxidoreductase [Paraliomyxa miuraensis]MCX4242017.1 FAD-dependent oxidoreductase [Paraliomyxa miuraensis]
MVQVWHHQADVVIVGSGAAALAAASAAAAEGVDVIVLEAASEAGGTTRRSGGAMWIPNNSLMQAAGLTDPRNEALALMAQLAHPSIYDPDSPTLGLSQHAYDLLAAFYDNGADVVDALTAAGALDLIILPPLGYGTSPISDPDYHAELPQNAAPIGRVLTAQTPPGSFEWPGVYLADGMIAHVQSLGIPILLEHRVEHVIAGPLGSVLGVVANHAGQKVRVRAKRGVVFATGGFTHDPRKVLSFTRGPIFGTGAVPQGSGAFLDIATGLGAAIGNLANGFFFQVALEAALESGGAISQPDAFVFLPYGDSMIIVDKHGRRIVNEKAMYHERTQSHFVYTYNEFPNLVQIMIWDDPVMQEPTFWPWRGGVPFPGASSPWVMTGNTLQELSDAIAARLQSLQGQHGIAAAVGPDVALSPDFATNLAATIDRFNGFAATGVDLDFHRGETPLEPAWQGPSRGAPNRTMTAFTPAGPYYALLLGAGTLDSCGGPVINQSGEVLRPDGTSIPGLYGAGNCIASPTGQGYFGAGGTIGPAIVFGYLAGRAAAQRSIGLGN